MPAVTDNFNKRDFWVKENLSYATPNSRARKCAHRIADLSHGEPCDGVDMVIHNPAPWRCEGAAA